MWVVAIGAAAIFLRAIFAPEPERTGWQAKTSGECREFSAWCEQIGHQAADRGDYELAQRAGSASRALADGECDRIDEVSVNELLVALRDRGQLPVGQ